MWPKLTDLTDSQLKFKWPTFVSVASDRFWLQTATDYSLFLTWQHGLSSTPTLRSHQWCASMPSLAAGPRASRIQDRRADLQSSLHVASRPGICDHSTALLMCLVGFLCAPLAPTVSLYHPSDFLRLAAQLFRLPLPRSGTHCRTVSSQWRHYSPSGAIWRHFCSSALFASTTVDLAVVILAYLGHYKNELINWLARPIRDCFRFDQLRKFRSVSVSWEWTK